MTHFNRLIGRSAEIQQLINTASMIAATDVTVLIEGATGTGKELVARAIHSASPRHEQAFIAVNCAALPEALIESQLFGHKKGAFTGADSDHKGFVQQAEQGTLFLDEIGELPLALQAKLLRFLEYGECQRLGDSLPLKTNVRILAATNRNLQQQVQEGAFRQDLYYRLNIVPVRLPELASRTDDIKLLAQHFLKVLSQQYQLPQPSFSASAMRKLQQHAWPGNVRELKNLCESLLILLQGNNIDEANLPLQFHAASASASTSATDFVLSPKGIKLDELEIDLLKQSLQLSSGNKTRAAGLLGITRDVFLYRLKKYSITS